MTPGDPRAFNTKGPRSIRQIDMELDRRGGIEMKRGLNGTAGRPECVQAAGLFGTGGGGNGPKCHTTGDGGSFTQEAGFVSEWWAAHVESISRDAHTVITQRTYPRRRESDGQLLVGLSRCSSCWTLLW